MNETTKFQAWQLLDCAWCDHKAAGNALHVYDGQWFASCGKHGRKFEPFKPMTPFDEAVSRSAAEFRAELDEARAEEAKKSKRKPWWKRSKL